MVAVEMVEEGLIDRREALRRVQPRHLIQILAPDHNAIEVVEILTESARTSKVGIGNISLIPVEELLRIPTGGRGLAAA